MSEPPITAGPRIDAYCHVGLPRFGTPEDALTVLDLWRIERAVFVLGPGVPDYRLLFGALRAYGERVRGIGIPFGEDADQIRGSVQLQLNAGVMGLRVEPRTLSSYPDVTAMLGERGRWLYAIGAASSATVAQTLLEWLEAYPEAHIAAPHFLRPGTPSPSDGDGASPVRDLIAHPRFYPIFSRHGGIGSREPYPHPDLLPWVEEVIDLAGWDHVLWGSEYPVYTWRNETLETVLAWLPELSDEMEDQNRDAFLGANAQRVLFDAPPPPINDVRIPAWVEVQFNRDRTVPLFPDGLTMPMDVYALLHHRYVRALREAPRMTLAAFVMELIKEQV